MSLRYTDVSKFVANYSREFRITFIVTSSINIIFAITTIVANSIIIIAMAKRINLKKPYYALLFCLAMSDLGIGLLSQPIYIIWKIDWLLNEMMSSYEEFSTACRITSVFFAGVSFLTMTEVCLERYFCLHYHLRYETVATKGRVLVVCCFPWMFVGVLSILDVLFGKVLFYATVLVMPLCIIVSIACHINLLLILRRHHSQISVLFEAGTATREATVNEISNSPGIINDNQGITNSNPRITNNSPGIIDNSPGIIDNSPRITNNSPETENVCKFRKSTTNLLLLFIILILCYSPYFLVQACFGDSQSLSLGITRNLTMTLIFINSSLNPVLFCYRISEIRKAVKRLFLSANASSD